MIDLQSSDIWKIQLTIAINFISSKDSEKEREMYSTSDNIKFTSYTDVNKVVKEIFESLLTRYQNNLEASMRQSEFMYNAVQLLHYKCHKVNFKRGSSYVDSPVWVKKKKATMNPKNDDDKCFRYSATVASNYNEIEYNPERVSNIVLFKSKYNWQEINYSSKLDDWKGFEKNNPTVALNILYVKEKEIFQAYISNNNSTREKQIILLMISNEESEKKKCWHYLAVKKISASLH